MNDQSLIERAHITGRPAHVARAVVVAVEGFKERLINLPNGIPIVDGRPHLMLNRVARATFFDQYVIGLAIQEIANETGKIVTIVYVGDDPGPQTSPASPDIEFED